LVLNIGFLLEKNINKSKLVKLLLLKDY